VGFFEWLNRWQVAVATVLIVAGLDFGFYLGVQHSRQPNTSLLGNPFHLGQDPSKVPDTAPAERGGFQRTVERTERRAGPGEATRPTTTLLSTPSTRPSASASAPTSATSPP
jgi:hypothetical protein